MLLYSRSIRIKRWKYATHTFFFGLNSHHRDSLQLSSSVVMCSKSIGTFSGRFRRGGGSLRSRITQHFKKIPNEEQTEKAFLYSTLSVLLRSTRVIPLLQSVLLQASTYAVSKMYQTAFASSSDKCELKHGLLPLLHSVKILLVRFL